MIVEWVETRAKSIAEAIELALDQLGVDESELDYEVLEEPKAGLFGRVRGEAAIRARVRPAQRSTEKKPRTKAAPKVAATPAPVAAPAKTPRVQKAVAAQASVASTAPSTPTKRRPSASTQAQAAAAAVAEAEVNPAPRRERRPAVERAARPERRPLGDDVAVDLSAVAASGIRFVEGLLEAAGLEAQVGSRIIDAQTLELEVTGDSLGVLVGPKGATLLAFQELVRTYVHHDTGGRSGRLMLDVAGYRQKRRVALEAFTRQVVASVLDAGERRAMEPMNAVDRKVVHDTANDIVGVRSISEGEDPFRYVVLLPE
jgi:spoIIIJ-associated protein